MFMPIPLNIKKTSHRIFYNKLHAVYQFKFEKGDINALTITKAAIISTEKHERFK